jgi:hypothetical protein
MVNEEKPGLKPKSRQTVTGQLLDPRLLPKQHFKLCGSVRFTSCTLALSMPISQLVLQPAAIWIFKTCSLLLSRPGGLTC